MKTSTVFNRCLNIAVLCTWALGVSTVSLAAPEESLPESVDLFAARDQGKLVLKLVLADEKTGVILLRNTTSQPLSVLLPESFAGVPASGQQLTTPDAPQGVGGPLSSSVPGGSFTVPPEKTIRLSTKSVCLEFGKPTPNRKMRYNIVPLQNFNRDPRIEELMRFYGEGRVPQHVIQGTAWRIANGLNWKQLRKIRHPRTGRLLFSISDLKLAQELERQIQLRLKARQQRKDSLADDEVVKKKS